MSKTVKKGVKNTSNNYFEDGYHSKQYKKNTMQRKQRKQFDNALRSRDLSKILVYEDQL